MKTYTAFGVEYIKPQVVLMNQPNLVNLELSSRLAYDSFSSSEHEHIRDWYRDKPVTDIEHSRLVDDLVYTYHHESIMEHAVFTFYIKDTTRGVLQEQMRTRLASPTVRSTRYTMTDIIYAFLAAHTTKDYDHFHNTITDLQVFNIVTESVLATSITSLYESMEGYMLHIGKEQFCKYTLAKDNFEIIAQCSIEDTPSFIYTTLQSNKAKRNAGDCLKGIIVTDSWTVELMWTINLRSLKNFIVQRDSGAAYIQIQELAKQVLEATPDKFKRLLGKKYQTVVHND